MTLRSSKQTEAQAASLERELEERLAEHRDVEARIRATSPRYAALTQPQPLTVAEIQRDVLDPRTTLLEFALGSERSYAWVVTTDRIVTIQLPGRTEIETAARGVYETMSTRGRRLSTPSGSARSATTLDAESLSAARTTSRILLEPVAPHLGSSKRLLIAGEGTLAYLPFAALPIPGAGEDTPLLARYEIINVPSASTLGVLRREWVTGHRLPRLSPSSRTRSSRATTGASGPPVARSPQRRLQRLLHRPLGRNHGISNAPVPTWAFPIWGARIPRLLFSRREAEAILALAPKDGRFGALDFDANRTAATSPSLADYRIVHFATHAFLNATHPELSGIVLSRVDWQGRPQPGFLRLQDIYNLRLRADLVVLSACRTGLGKDVKGEGLIGLTRGFMYAGAPRVVATLWQVDDEATAEIMMRFYLWHPSRRAFGGGVSASRAAPPCVKPDAGDCRTTGLRSLSRVNGGRSIRDRDGRRAGPLRGEAGRKVTPRPRS